MGDRRAELHALRILWSTLRSYVVPELVSPLAKDRAKRADAALLRLNASLVHLPHLQSEYASRYGALLARARVLAKQRNTFALPAALSAADGSDNPVFIGVPVVARELEALLAALAADRSTHESAPDEVAALDRLLHDVVQLEAVCRNDYESRVMALAAEAGADLADQDREVTAAALQRYLQNQPQAGARVSVRKVQEVPGGRSKRTVLVELENSGRLPPELVLRFDTGRGTGTTVEQEFPILSLVARRGLPVPEPLWLEKSGAAFGFPFIVFRRMPGASAGDLIEGAFRKLPATGRALAKALAQVHAAGGELIANPAERGSAVPHTHQLLTHYFDYWRSKKPFPSLVIETAFIWLYRNLDGGLGEATVVHADTGFHNLLLDDQGNGCLLDWEFAHFGDPAEDLASCRPAVEKCMPWSDFMAEYQAHGGLPVSDFRLRYFEIWRPLRNAVVCGTVLHSLMNGEAHDIDPVTISLSTFARLQADLARSLEAVTGP